MEGTCLQMVNDSFLYSFLVVTHNLWFAQDGSLIASDSTDQFPWGSLNGSLAPSTTTAPPDHFNDTPPQSCPGDIRQPQYHHSISDSEEYLGGPAPVRRPLGSVFTYKLLVHYPGTF